MFQNQEFPGMVKVRVANTGIGVSLDKTNCFNRSVKSMVPVRASTVPAWTISQKLVEAMGCGGTAWARGGSTVTFTVPLYQEPVVSAPTGIRYRVLRFEFKSPTPYSLTFLTAD